MTEFNASLIRDYGVFARSILGVVVIALLVGCSSSGSDVVSGDVEPDSQTRPSIDLGTGGASSTSDAGLDSSLLGDSGPTRVDRGLSDGGCSAVAEVCDQVDNDCDGRVDEGFSVGDVCQSGEGACSSPGHIGCGEDGSAVCTPDDGDATPSGRDEMCNGGDDDCDGLVDETPTDVGAACDTGGVGACQAGVTVCMNGTLTCSAARAPARERCNGDDDDCDGAVDEDFAVGQACQSGVGACLSLGQLVCDAAAEGVLCDAEPGMSRQESCDAVDNDCDGVTDEGASMDAPCITGELGICASGRSVCVDGQQRCVRRQEPRMELCDGLDDDCDGLVDEMTPGEGDHCNTGQPGLCRSGARTCRDGRMVCRAVRSAVPETCDERDDDCDGRVDESAAGTGVACDPGWQAEVCARRAVTACVDGVVLCQPDERPADPCDGVDNDCDGNVGEDLLGQACATGLLGRCEVGAWLCEGAEARCVASLEPGCETDNGSDDDCDGAVDEAPERFCAPAETQVTRSCLEDNNRIAGFDMVVTPQGHIWLVRAVTNSGTVFFGEVRDDGALTQEQIYGRTAVFPNRPMVDAAITVFEAQPAVCFWKATSGTLFFARRTGPNNWVTEEIIDQDQSGQDCDIAVVDGRVVVAYRDGNSLWLARRNAADNWVREEIDAPGTTVAHGLDMATQEGQIYIAHQDIDNAQLRLTYGVPGAWTNLVVSDRFISGFRPSVDLDEGALYILHGQQPDRVDEGSDSAIFLSRAPLADIPLVETRRIEGGSLGGGQSVIRFRESALGFVRYRLRDAVFGNQDGLYLYTLGDRLNQRPLEVANAADRRHLYTRLVAQPDPFGLPVLGFSDEGGSFRGDNGYGKICFYRPNDSDGDRVPDVAEISQYNTNPDDPDTDGDGRTDGQEVLEDGTDPTEPNP